MQKVDHNGDTTTIEESANRPFKKAKCSKSSVLDDPNISTSSVVSECSKPISSDNQSSVDKLPSPTSPIISTSSLVSELMDGDTISADDDKERVSTNDEKQPDELMNEDTISAHDDKETVSADDEKQPDEDKRMINVATYDYLPQGIIFSFCLYLFTYDFHITK